VSKKLFMVRMENGDSMILQAEEEEQALKDALGDEEGLKREVAKCKVDHPELDEADIRLDFMRAGLGPQRATVRELENFSCSVCMDEEGELGLLMEGEDTLDEVYVDYPVLLAAQLAGSPEGDIHFEPHGYTEEARARIDEAMETERTRLTFAEAAGK